MFKLPFEHYNEPSIAQRLFAKEPKMPSKKSTVSIVDESNEFVKFLTIDLYEPFIFRPDDAFQFEPHVRIAQFEVPNMDLATTAGDEYKSYNAFNLSKMCCVYLDSDDLVVRKNVKIIIS